MILLRWLLAAPVMLAMVAVAKVVQYASVDAFGQQLGFNVASVVGVLPVIAVYIIAAVKLPHVRGVTR